MEVETILKKSGLVKNWKAEDILIWIEQYLSGRLVFASSMGAEDQVVFDIICRLDLNIDIFTLDTGRLFNETYDLIVETERRYGKKINIFFPERWSVEKMLREHDVNFFYGSVESRKHCCDVRKLEPLRRALLPYSSWICGLRKGQSVTREKISAVEWDNANQMLKVNPLHSWSEDDVWAYIKKHDVPYNKLHDKGFLSIGCACCTRAVKEGEGVRAGRWWWEAPEHKECGLHWTDGKLERLRF